MRLAIYDDNGVDLKAMREVFHRTAPEHAVEACSDGRKLLDAIARGRAYDLLFLDIIMPGITGMELAREVGRIAPDTPVVFLTDSEGGTPGRAAAAAPLYGVAQRPIPRLLLPDAVRIIER